MQLIARLGGFAGTDMGQHTIGIQDPLNQYLNLATTGLLTIESCRNHLGIIKHQQITGLYHLKKITKTCMLKGLGGRIQIEQPTALPLSRRLSGNQFIGKLKFKNITAHRAY